MIAYDKVYSILLKQMYCLACNVVLNAHRCRDEIEQFISTDKHYYIP